MDLKTMLGQLFVFDARNVANTIDSAITPDIRHFIRAYKPGGIILFNNIYSREQIARWLKGWKVSYAEEGLPGEFIVTVDQRGGDSVILAPRHGGVEYPAPLAQSAIPTDPEALGRELGEIVARDILKAGMNLALAPYSDFTEHTRFLRNKFGNAMYGSDIEANASLAKGLIEGMHSEGLLATYCTFPGGYGSIEEDPHKTVAYINSELSDLREKIYRAPIAAIQSGVDSIMLSHYIFPALDSLPATISPVVIQRVLREELGFEGVVMTDSMKMKGITDFAGSPGEGVIRALEAGADLILCATVDMYDAALEAVESGRIPASRIEESYRRVLKLKQKLAKQPDPAYCGKSAEDEGRAAYWVGKSMTWLRKPSNWLPMHCGAPAVAIANWSNMLSAVHETAGAGVQSALMFELKDTSYLHYHHCPKEEYTEMNFQSMLKRTKEGQHVIFGTESSEGLHQAARLKEHGREVWVIHAGRVCLAQEAPELLDTILLCYSRNSIACRKAAEVFYGLIEANGKVPAPL